MSGDRRNVRLGTRLPPATSLHSTSDRNHPIVRTRLVLVACLMAVTPSIMPAQGKKEPRRPKLAAGADTNDARAYYDFAMQQLTKEPEDAANALYWATRL